jgi:hypothetical protein
MRAQSVRKFGLSASLAGREGGESQTIVGPPLIASRFGMPSFGVRHYSHLVFNEPDNSSAPRTLGPAIVPGTDKDADSNLLHSGGTNRGNRPDKGPWKAGSKELGPAAKERYRFPLPRKTPSPGPPDSAPTARQAKNQVSVLNWSNIPKSKSAGNAPNTEHIPTRPGLRIDCGSVPLAPTAKDSLESEWVRQNGSFFPLHRPGDPRSRFRFPHTLLFVPRGECLQSGISKFLNFSSFNIKFNYIMNVFFVNIKILFACDVIKHG